ncbi:hypothetical protein LSH36_56g00017 [Paralvinella palmiformis]|uniref:DNA polymerase eta n=1 Tax=Paralvinella palmiformis TaxID=53620 RepID=A0AAD9NF80_9ANNE|nr:hypothetical protein LSH36_56g00017 [Paralvinella palmiformis]
MSQDRVIVLVDMDCFYVQVEQRLTPGYHGKPCAVVQYKKYKGGSLIAVSYEARAKGVKRGMMGDDAKALCPDIHLFRVAEVRGKADLTKYREAGAEVIDVLSSFSQSVERASIDEAYVDLTEEVNKRLSQYIDLPSEELKNTFIIGWEEKKPNDDETDTGVQSWLEHIQTDDSDDMQQQHDKKLAVGALITEQMRAAVYEQTGFRCSGGIAHNKMLAKLSCGLHKPNKQTVLPQHSVHGLFTSLPIRKVRNLGGKFGESLTERLGVENMADICQYSLDQLQQMFGDKSGFWLYETSHGIDHEPVLARKTVKSIGCSKNFRGKDHLNTKVMVKQWLMNFASEVTERLEKDKENYHRLATHLTVYCTRKEGDRIMSASRSCPLSRYDAKQIADNAFNLLSTFNIAPSHQADWLPPITEMGMSAGKFVDISTNGTPSIASFLTQTTSRQREPTSENSLESRKQPDPDIPSPSCRLDTSGPCDDMGKRKSSKDDAGLSRNNLYEKTSMCMNSETFGLNIQDTALPSKKNTINQFFGEHPSKKTEDSAASRQEAHSPKGFFARRRMHCLGDDGDRLERAFSNTMSDANSAKSTSSGPSRTVDKSNDLWDLSERERSFIFDGCVLDKTGVNSGWENLVNNSLEPSSSHSLQGIVECKKKSEDLLPTADSEGRVSVDELCTDSRERENPFTGSTNAGGMSLPPNSNNNTDVIDGMICDDDSLSPSDIMKCDECGKLLPVWHMPEHSDYHFAVQVQKQCQNDLDSKLTNSSHASCKKSVKRKSSGKIGRPSKLSKMGELAPNLERFFKKI